MKLELTPPFIITPRLMAGVQIGNAFISIGYGRRCPDSEGRTVYDIWIDLPGRKGFHVTDVKSGCQGGGLQEGMCSLLAFLGAAGEASASSDNLNLFPMPINKWAHQMSDEISSLQMEIEESQEALIIEK